MSSQPGPAGGRPARAEGEARLSHRARWHARARHRFETRWRRSLGLRLVLLFMLLALAMSATFLFGMRSALGVGWREVMRPLVADYVDHLARDLGSPPDPARARAMTERLPLSIRIEGPSVQWRSDAGRSKPDPREPWQGEGRGPHGMDPEGLTRTTADGHRIHFGLDTEGWVRQPRNIGLFTLAVLLALTALAWGLVHRLFRPVKEIGEGALRYGEGDFSRPIPVRRRDELGQLAERVNTMAGALSHMLDAKRGLLLAISHELRSPLTRARLNAELVGEGPERDALLRDLGQMRDLIDDLLESERLAQPHATLQREPTELHELVQTLMATSFAGRAIVVDLPAALPAGAVDRSRLSLLLRNLLDNALRHGAGAASPPELRATLVGEAAHRQLRLSVRDHGPGVAEDQLPRLAEAFHRTDAARQRATGGVGLGLYLCRLVAQAHGGTLSLHAARPGLEVRVELPWPGATGHADASGR